MPTTLTTKGQVTIPKRVRNALGLSPGDAVDFAVNGEGQVVIRKAARRNKVQRDRFEASRGMAPVKWRTDDLMALLRPND